VPASTPLSTVAIGASPAVLSGTPPPPSCVVTGWPESIPWLPESWPVAASAVVTIAASA
jgi:hypothetical protein